MRRPRYSRELVDGWFASADWPGLVVIQKALVCHPSFDRSRADLGLPLSLFAINEGMIWLALSDRSGTLSYFEATSEPRQQAMLKAMANLAPSELSEMYQRGMQDWNQPERAEEIDVWFSSHINTRRIEQWLWRVAKAERPLIESLLI